MIDSGMIDIHGHVVHAEALWERSSNTLPLDWQNNRDALSNVQRFYPIHYPRVLTKRVNRMETTCSFLPVLLPRRISRERLTQNVLSV